MAAVARLSPEQWAKVQQVWEDDPRESYEWVVRELGLSIAGAAVRKRAKAAGKEWKKSEKSSGGSALGERSVKKEKRAENPVKSAASAPRQYVGDLEGRSALVGKSEGGEESPPKGFRKGSIPRRSKKPSTAVIDADTGLIEQADARSKKAAAKGSHRQGSQGSDCEGSGYEGSGHKWEMNLPDDDYLWRDAAPMVRPREDDEPRGRPTVYQKIFPNQAFRHCLLGATNDDLAALFQVSVRTINRWLVEHKEFCHAVQAGKADADARVASAVFKRAIGFTVPEAHVSNYKGEITITTLEKFYPPDMGAAAMWLYNRQPERWSSNPELPVKEAGSDTPFDDELDAIYADSMRASKERAAQARLDRERHGLFGKNSQLDMVEDELPLLAGEGEDGS